MFRITDLTEREADLIEHFVPVTVDEGGGFTNFRETVTKTSLLVDRLNAIEYLDFDHLKNYLQTIERAEGINAEVEQVVQVINEIVCERYS